MMGRLFWPLTAAFFGLAVHLVTVLYMPGLMFQRSLSRLTEGAKPNSFFVMKPENQSSLVPTATAQDIVGLCLLDFAKGTVVISAHVPQTLWRLAIYSQSGQQVYGINDVQAGSGGFSVEVARAKSLLQQITGKPDAEDAAQIENVGWHAEVPEAKGIAVLWVPVPDALQRNALESALKDISCKVK
ncbi:MAG: hypothetical protein KGO53_00430 [Alphaproteobacteria bacterium]|nr:hypothetical protein [Alphaproteobacteria bacterium]